MTTTIVFAGAADADLSSSDAAYTAAANGTGVIATPVGTVNELWVGQFLFGSFACYEGFVDFDLTFMHQGHVVTSAIMQTWLITDNSATDFNCIALLYDWGASVTSTDWRTPAWQQTAGAWWTTRNTAGMGAAGSYKSWNDSTDQHALLNLLAGTEVNYCLSSDRLLSKLTPGGAEYVTWSSTNVAGTTQDPKLTIVYSDELAPDTPDEGGLVVGDAVEQTADTFLQPNAPSTAVASAVVIEWDFDNDGDFDQSVENITTYVLAAETVIGREFPSGLTGETRPGGLKLTLDNRDGRFNYYNPTSPLAAAPFSLRAGRKIRIRTSDAVPDDPILLARDRFDRVDGALGLAETGQLWANSPGGFTVRSRVAAANAVYGSDNVALLDVGVTDMYVQGTIRQIPQSNDNRYGGLYARYLNVSNYTRVRYNPVLRNVTIADNNAGTFLTLATASNIDGWEGMTLGLGIVGQVATAYVAGVAVCTATLTRAVSGTKAGLFALYSQFTGRSPEIGDFHVWNHVGGEVSGIIWTGDVTVLDVDVDVAAPSTASLSADGVLVRAASAEIASPRVPIGGASTGFLIGDVFQRAGMLHPPTPLNRGAITTGPVGIPDGKALEMARLFEDTEQGFIYETQEGAVSFQDSTARAAAPSQAWFSDTPGVGQFPFSHVQPIDTRGQLINRVTAGVAPDAPSGVSWVQRSGSGHVDILLPTTTAGDLVLVFVANSQNGGQDWLTPIWWTSHRDLKGALGMRIYSHWCDGTESATTVRFRTWNGAEIGVWIAHVVRIQNWFEGNNGVLVSEPVGGDDPAGLDISWGRKSTLFLAVVVGIGGAGNMTYAGVLDPPDGYDWLTGIGGIAHGVADAQDTGIVSAYKIDVTDSEDATAFLALANTIIRESVVVAVRGYNGEHTKATLDNPKIVGGDGRFVTTEDPVSQADFNAILSHREPSNLFATEAAAGTYGGSVTAAYGEERPIISLSFWATSSAALRAQAIARRVGHKITVTASGSTGLGFQRQFFIENVSHKFSAAGKLWECTWQLSPA